MNSNEVPYNTIPHYVAPHYRCGDLSINEMRVLLWLRMIGNPYGNATTSLHDLKDDVFPDIDLKINTINAILLKLRQKQYIFYKPRQGKSGTFDIELNHWKRPDKSYKTLDKHFAEPRRWIEEEEKPTEHTDYPQAESSESNQKSGVSNQKLNEQRSQLIKKVSIGHDGSQIRSYHNEHDTKHQIENHDNTLGNYEGRRTLVSAFEPRNHEEERCTEIAAAVGERHINPLLAVLRKDGLRIIERAYGLYREDKQNGKRIDNSAAYFYGIIKKLKNQQ